ncbi:hypothetical protein FG051_01620 [Companilactobacillus futsaii]|uniref:Uncharacterized protein n=1 Tax=Companilactobacillus futsaii TaxID=938155 RepID=A0A5B7SW06_9LACO|nr:hypothetical protein FG051_01620 [Companilactobacillus futsaii]
MILNIIKRIKDGEIYSLIGVKMPSSVRPWKIAGTLWARFCVFGAMQKLKIASAMFQPATGFLRTTAY